MLIVEVEDFAGHIVSRVLSWKDKRYILDLYRKVPPCRLILKKGTTGIKKIKILMLWVPPYAVLKYWQRKS